MIKKYIIILSGLILPFTSQAQIGINTENPKGLLHIDGAHTTATTNPILGSISTAQAVDDVIITPNGNVGVGILSPTAKIHITATNSTPSMRIEDGTQGKEKILRSDANGNTSWINQLSSGGFIYNILGGATYPNNQVNLVKTMPITETGNYLVIIRWWGRVTQAQGSANNEISAYFYLDESTDATTARGSQKDGIEYYLNAVVGVPYCLTTSLYAFATAGNYLKIFILPSVGGGDWQIGIPSTSAPVLNPSIILFQI